MDERAIAAAVVAVLDEVEGELWGGLNYPGTTWRHEALKRIRKPWREKLEDNEGREEP